MEANPSNWSIGDFVTIGGLISAAVLWWKKNPWRKMKNIWLGPDRVQDINLKLDTIISALSLVMSMTQNTWRVMDCPLWRSDAHGRMIHVNLFMLKILYRQESEMLGHGWINSVHEADRDRVSSAWDKAVENKTNFYLHYNLTSATGEIIPVIGEAFKLTDQAGEILGFMGRIILIDEK
jgi:PAS domain-containing protein